MATEKELSSLYDEIDELLTNVICKEEKKARACADADSDFNYSLYSNAIKEYDVLRDYDIPLPLFHREVPRIPISLAMELISGVKEYEDHLTISEINKLLSVVRAERISKYVETNDYYRMLQGLPPMSDTENDWVYYKGYPMHDLPIDLYYEVQRNGWLNLVINNYPEKQYLLYIDKNIDMMFAREAGQFDILWTPTDSKYNKFRECYNKERMVFMRILHSDFLSSTTDYAEARELVTLKLQAILLYKLETHSNELDKVEFTKEEAVRIWSEFGLSFPKNMPESYRNTTTFLLNYLVSMKGTNRAMEYITNKLFSGIKLYKYYIRKTHKLGMTYPVPADTKPEDFYNIEFILRPFYATNIVDYKEDDTDEKILTYDDVVKMDPRWRDSKEVKDAVFGGEFSYVESKYLSLDNFINLSEFTNMFSILTRVMVEHRSALETYHYNIPSASSTENVFSILVYYLALVTRFLEGKEVKIPDSLEDISEIFGFRIPENIAELRIRFAWFFSKSDYSWLLDQFPDAITTNDSFFNFVINTDRILGLDSYMYDLLESCKNWEEYELASSIFDLVRIVNKSPESYGITPSLDGMSYQQWLLENNPALYKAYYKVVGNSDSFIVEIDTLTQILVNIFENSVSPNYTPTNITKVVNDFNTISNGVSKYLLYILNLFKSYSADFLNETVSFYFDSKYMPNRQIDNLRIDGSYNVSKFENNSDWDAVIAEPKTLKHIADVLVQSSNILGCTVFGDIKLNPQEE